jgi:hypothetical protein
VGTVQRRAEPGQKIMPNAHAPASTQSCASSSEVMPQSLTRGASTPGRLVARLGPHPTTSRTSDSEPMWRSTAVR